jgi:hypothetical protein
MCPFLYGRQKVLLLVLVSERKRAPLAVISFVHLQPVVGQATIRVYICSYLFDNGENVCSTILQGKLKESKWHRFRTKAANAIEISESR